VNPPAGVRADLKRVFGAAIAAADADHAVRRAFAEPTDFEADLLGTSRLWVLAVGKAAGAMAAACEAQLGDRIVGGLVVTKDGHGVPVERLKLCEAGHPVPDGRSERAAREALALVARAQPGDGLLVLLSGGASSLLCGPAPGLTLANLADCTEQLLAAGADIAELNTVRKHLSAVSGGRLGVAARTDRICVWGISDVPGDRWDVIGSGPFCGDPTRFRDSWKVLERRALLDRVPTSVRDHLAAGVRGEVAETPKPAAPEFARVQARLLATNATAIAAAAAEARRVGWRTFEFEAGLRGEAREVGRRLAALVPALRAGDAAGRPLCLVAGGETVVTVRGPGRGGRSQELALAAAVELEGVADATLLAAGTDGTDGPTDAAGAFADGGTVARGAAAGFDVRAALAANDSNGFFAGEGGLFTTGPTLTNVMDLALLAVGAPSRRGSSGKFAGGVSPG